MDYLKKINKKLATHNIAPLNNDQYYCVRACGKRNWITEDEETKRDLNWQRLYNAIKDVRKTDKITVTPSSIDDFKDIDYHLLAEDEYYGFRMYYPIITVLTPKTGKVKLMTSEYDV